MTIFVLFFVVCSIFLLVILNHFMPHKGWVLFTFGILFPFLILINRSYEQPDFENYKLIYDNISQPGGWLIYFGSIEPFFIGILKVFSFIGVDYYFSSNVMLFLISIIFSFSAVLFCRNSAEESFILAFLFFSSYYFPFLSLNVVRQGFAVAFFSLGLSYYYNSSNKSMIYFMIAILFHYSSALIVATVVVASFLIKRVSYKFIILLIFLSFVFGVVDLFSLLPLPEFFSLRVEKLKYYGDSNTSSLAKLALYSLFFVFYASLAFFLNKVDKKTFFFNATFLCLALIFLNYGELLDRILMYSLVFGALLVLTSYRLFKSQSLSYLLFAVFCCLSFLLVMLSPPTQGFIS